MCHQKIYKIVDKALSSGSVMYTLKEIAKSFSEKGNKLAGQKADVLKFSQLHLSFSVNYFVTVIHYDTVHQQLSLIGESNQNF